VRRVAGTRLAEPWFRRCLGAPLLGSAAGADQGDAGFAARLWAGVVVGCGVVGLPGEEVGEVVAYGREHLCDGHVATQLTTQRRDPGVGDAAGDEPVVPAQVDVAVEGETVHRHAPADPDA